MNNTYEKPLFKPINFSIQNGDRICIKGKNGAGKSSIIKAIINKENKYKGTVKRSVWLSEAGVNSPTYSDEDFLKQAASVAFAWKKVNALEGIDAWQWHNWFDHPGDGACFGLRKYLDESYKGEAKPVWEVYQKAGTNEEDEYFEQFLPLIGIPDWNIIENF